MILYIDDLPKELRKVDDFDVVMKDGTSPVIVKYQIVGEVSSGNTTPIYGMFPQVIDPDEVYSVIINGYEIVIS